MKVALITGITGQDGSYLADLLLAKNIKVTRIALGIPVGGDLKYMDYMTLKHSFNSRIRI